jgi:hypothetical protein
MDNIYAQIEQILIEELIKGLAAASVKYSGPLKAVSDKSTGAVRVMGDQVLHMIEAGRKPGAPPPPMLRLIQLAKKYGAADPNRVAWLIRRSMVKKGIKGRWFKKEVRKAVMKRALPLIKEAVSNVAQKLAQNNQEIVV